MSGTGLIHLYCGDGKGKTTTRYLRVCGTRARAARWCWRSF